MITPTHRSAASGAAPLLDSSFTARAGDDRTAIVDGERSLSWRELDEAVARTASALRALGVTAGQAVCWQLPNQAEAVVIHLAALRIGAISTPIVPIYRHREVDFILRQSNAPVIVIPDQFRGFDFAAMMRELKPGLPDLRQVVVVGDSFGDDLSFSALPAGTDTVATADERTPDSVAVLLYTSGTTGDPKGVLHTHRTLSEEVRSFARFFSLGRDDVVLMPSPLTHITGVVFGIHLPAELGSSSVLQAVWDADAAWGLMKRHSCRVMVGATPFLHGLLDATPKGNDRPHLNLFACGGADVPPALIERATKELGCLIVRGYGSTELPTATACNGADPLEKRATTDGRPIEAVGVRIVGTDGTPAPAGSQGVVQVRGPELFVGYLDAGLNDAAFTTDGWFDSGDLGVVDDAGYLSISGRLKDVIIRGGENIAAKEIESLVAQHRNVADVAVVGMPDPVLVERVCAFVVLREGAALTRDELNQFLTGFRIAVQKLPERLEVISELPRTASGKVQKHILRALVAEHRVAESDTPQDQEVHRGLL